MSTVTTIPTGPHVAEQFHDAHQQRDVASLGMWGFLATEILFFGGLFVAFAVYRLRWHDSFVRGSLDLKWYLGGINTAVLLFSSFFMALAVRAAQLGGNRLIIRNLIVTMALAALFVSIKGLEYYLEWDEHLVPGRNWRFEAPADSQESAVTRAFAGFDRWFDRAIHEPPSHGPRAQQEPLFMCFYFIMTAIHATHMLIGIGLMAWLVIEARAGKFSAGWHNPVEVVGLYWHFVDTVWVFLFPVLYLLRNP